MSKRVREGKKRILFVQLASSGDCVLVTPLVKQIKEEQPDCLLTWAIGTSYKNILNENPYIDNILEVKINTVEEVQPAREKFEKIAFDLKKAGKYDEVIITDYTPINYEKYFLTTRSFLFRSFGRDVKTDVTPFIRLCDREKENVRRFADKNRLKEYRNVILIESAPRTNQSRMNPEVARQLALKVTSKYKDIAVILSSNHALDSKQDRVIDASCLSFRENAELTKYCSLLIGCSSGISWLMTSVAARKLPTIQIINSNWWLASMTMDHYLLKLPYEHIIEIADDKIEQVSVIIDVILSKGFDEARRLYNSPVIIPARMIPSTVKRLLKLKRFKEIEPFLRLVKDFYPVSLLFSTIARSAFDSLIYRLSGR